MPRDSSYTLSCYIIDDKLKIRHKIGYGLLLALLYPVALLPLRALYVFADFVAFILNNVLRYRRRVVTDNLTACFPEKSAGEIRCIRRDFYRDFADYIFETVKLLHISDSMMMRRMTFAGVDAMENALDSGRNIVIYFAHTFNWEWATSVTLHSRIQTERDVVFGQIYRPLRNVAFDRLMLKIRSRFNSVSISKTTTLRRLVEYVREGRLFEVGFMSDQKPSHQDPVRIVEFMGRPTAVITGTETVARRMDTAVFYWDMSKPRRGHYHIDVVPVSMDAAATNPGELTCRYFKLLEKTIRRRPSLWLWTHKRWKTSPRSWDETEPNTIITL